MATVAQPLASPDVDEHEDPRQFLMHDPLPRGKMNDMVMEAMHETNPIFWVVTVILAVIVVYTVGYQWSLVILEGQGWAGVTRPDYWGVFLVNTVFWIGISHAGTFISAILRVLKVESASSYRLGADCTNGTLTLYVDGQQIDSVTDSTYTTGGFALFAWSAEEVKTVNISFDDFLMTELP